MSMFTGKIGKVNWGASDVVDVTSWTFDSTCDVAETTAMSEANYYKTYTAGFKDWTATVEARAHDDGSDIGLDPSDLGAPYARLQLWFTRTAADGILLGNAVMTGFSQVEDAQDVVNVSYTFQGVGEAHWSDGV